MRKLATFLGAFISLLAAFHHVIAADLAKVDRTIVKEPKFVGKPEYCLIVFGPEAKNRVWLVRDGETLYADKSGDGDLTDPVEKIAAEKVDHYIVFNIGAVRIGKLEHRNLSIWASKISTGTDERQLDPLSRAALKKDKDAYMMSVSGEIEVPGLKGGGDDGRVSVKASFDANGPLLFAASPANAPVLHFGGPLKLTGDANPTLYRGIGNDLLLSVGTPGIGPGAFTHFDYEELIPESAFVIVEAEFPPNKPGDPPIKQRFELKERC